eukprot:3230214-Rhodomonas_salina.1
MMGWMATMSRSLACTDEHAAASWSCAPSARALQHQCRKISAGEQHPKRYNATTPQRYNATPAQPSAREPGLTKRAGPMWRGDASPRGPRM